MPTPPRVLEKSGDTYSLAREEQFRDMMVEKFYARSLFMPNPTDGNVGGGSPMAAVEMKTITSGKEHRFELFAADADYEEHTPGDELLSQQFEFDKLSISVDPYITKQFAVAFEDNNLAHWDSAPKLSARIAGDLSAEGDRRIVLTAIAAARTAALTKGGLTLHNGGNAVSRVAAGTGLSDAYPNSSTGATNFLDDVKELQYDMDTDNVPESGRLLIIDPWIRNILLNDTGIFNSDFTRAVGNEQNDRIIGKLFGFNVMEPYNSFPTTYDQSSDLPSKYHVDCSYTGSAGVPAALALCGASEGDAAVGVVVSDGLSAFTEIQRLRGQFMYVGRLMMGAGVLNPQCAGIIQARNS